MSKINHNKFGLIAEIIAVIFLKFKFYKILQKNYRNKLGEIDIIAVKNGVLVAVEVKARRKIRSFEEILTKNDTLFVIVKDELNETLINALKHIWETEKIFIVIQPIKRIQFNILEHILVPRHRILSENEKISIKTKYNIINDGQFPIITRFDPVAQAIGIRPGEVCEIIRPSKTAITEPYYRVCL